MKDKILEAKEKIESYIKENNYTWTIKELLKEYNKQKAGYYVSHTANVCLTKFEKEFKILSMEEMIINSELYELILFLKKEVEEIHLDDKDPWLLIYFYQLEDFQIELKKIFGNDLFIDNALENIFMKDNYLCIEITNLIEFCGYHESEAIKVIKKLREIEE